MIKIEDLKPEDLFREGRELGVLVLHRHRRYPSHRSTSAENTRVSSLEEAQKAHAEITEWAKEEKIEDAFVVVGDREEHKDFDKWSYETFTAWMAGDVGGPQDIVKAITRKAED